MDRSPTDSKPPSALIKLAWFSVAYNVLVIVWGAVVRATGSGAGCGNHWPLCNGQVIPVTPGTHTIIEFTHRMMTGGATFVILAVLLWTFRATPKGNRARTAAVWTGILLVTEALLGALLVKFGYVTDNQSNGRVIMQAIHFTNTLSLLASITLTAWLLTPRRAPVTGAPNLAIVTVAATVLAGATGAVAALADTLFPSTSFLAGLASDFAASSPIIVRLRWMHPAAALLSVVCAGLLAGRIQSAWSRVLIVLIGIQLLLGAADVLLLAPIWLQLLHLLTADVFWIALIVVAGEALQPRPLASALATSQLPAHSR